MDTQAPQYTPSTGNGTRSGNWVYNNNAWTYSPVSNGGQDFQVPPIPPVESEFSSPININHPAIQNEIENNPRFADILRRLQESGDPAALSAFQSAIDNYGQGTYSGRPVTAMDMETEIAKQMLDPNFNAYYKEMQDRDTADISDRLGLAKANFEAENTARAGAFQEDKAQQDTSAAQNGVLFSTGRVQKLNNLKSAYDADQASRLRALGTNTSLAARDFQYKYGNDAARGLSSYYSAGGNTFDPMKARDNVGSSGLSSLYDPSSSNFVGSVNKDKYKNAVTNASGILTTRGNKLNRFGYQYQF